MFARRERQQNDADASDAYRDAMRERPANRETSAENHPTTGCCDEQRTRGPAEATRTRQPGNDRAEHDRQSEPATQQSVHNTTDACSAANFESPMPGTSFNWATEAKLPCADR